MNKSIKFLDLSLQNQNQKKAFHKNLEQVVEKGDFIFGSSLKKFEEKIADYCSCKYALGLNSGTDALILTMKTFGIGKGDEVISVANSFIATIGAIVARGAKPVFVDVGDDYLIDADKIEEKITDKTKAILPVHLYGRVADMNKINKIAKKNNLKVIEDACQAIGSEYHNKKAGSLADAACFSLHPSKLLGVLGDGGFLTTNNKEISEKINKLRNHGLKNRDEADFFGVNSRLDTFQAGIALGKLNYLEKWIELRRKNELLYYEKLRSLPIQFPPEQKKGNRTNNYLFVIQLDKRDKLQEFLNQQGIDARVHYPIPIHLQKAAKYLGYKIGSLPETEKQAKKMLSLPIHQDLKKSEILRIADSINKFYKN